MAESTTAILIILHQTPTKVTDNSKTKVLIFSLNTDYRHEKIWQWFIEKHTHILNNDTFYLDETDCHTKSPKCTQIHTSKLKVTTSNNHYFIKIGKIAETEYYWSRQNIVQIFWWFNWMHRLPRLWLSRMRFMTDMSKSHYKSPDKYQ